MNAANASRILLSILLLLAPGLCVEAAPAPPAPAVPSSPAAAPTATPGGPRRNIGGPGDYALREKILHYISVDPDLRTEKFDVVMVNGGAVYSGTIGNCALKKKALMIAATIRGVINVTDEMTVPRGTIADADLAKAVVGTLSDAADALGLQALDVQVADGVLTLKGRVKDMMARKNAEDYAGRVLGITRIANLLQPDDAPSGTDDTSLKKAVVSYLRDFRTFSMPADVTVAVKDGVVTLTGKTHLYMGRQLAAVVAGLVHGVARVDNRIHIDPSFPPREMRIQAAP